MKNYVVRCEDTNGNVHYAEVRTKWPKVAMRLAVQMLEGIYDVSFEAKSAAVC